MTLCRACRVDVVLCAACAALVVPPPDALQLCLWPQVFMRERRVLLLEEREPHHSHGHVATQAQKRKSPYH